MAGMYLNLPGDNSDRLFIRILCVCGLCQLVAVWNVCFYWRANVWL